MNLCPTISSALRDNVDKGALSPKQKLLDVQKEVLIVQRCVVEGGSGAALGIDGIQNHLHLFPSTLSSGDRRQNLVSVGI
jgi:hypothetical protein